MKKEIEIIVSVSSESSIIPEMPMTYDGTPEDFAEQAKALVEECMVNIDEEDRQDVVIGDNWFWKWGHEVARLYNEDTGEFL